MEENIFNKIKQNMLNSYQSTINALIPQNDLFSDEIKLMMDKKEDIENAYGIELFEFYGIDINKLYYAYLMDYFEKVNNKSIPLCCVSNDGPYPLYGAMNTPDPIGYHDLFQINTHEETYLTINKDEYIGYCFPRCGKFSQNGHVIILRPLEDLDININSVLLSLQLSNMDFGLSITDDKLKDLNLLLYFDN